MNKQKLGQGQGYDWAELYASSTVHPKTHWYDAMISAAYVYPPPIYTGSITGLHIPFIKLGSQYDAGTSIASQASGWRFSISIPVMHCQHPTNQIVKKFDVRDIIWLVKKYFFMR